MGVILFGVIWFGQSAPAQSESAPKNVAIFIFKDVQIIDFTDPYQREFEVFTVGKSTVAVTGIGGLVVSPKYSFTNHPKIDILVVRGNGSKRSRDCTNDESSSKSAVNATSTPHFREDIREESNHQSDRSRPTRYTVTFQGRNRLNLSKWRDD